MKKNYGKYVGRIGKHMRFINKRLELIEELEELRKYAKPYGKSVIDAEITQLEIEMINVFKAIENEAENASLDLKGWDVES